MYINSKSISRLLYFEICYVLFYSGVVDLLNLPNALTYGIDIINIVLLVFFFYNKRIKNDISRYNLKPLANATVILFLFCLFFAIINAVKPQLVVWSVRNSFRYYPFFFLIITTWDSLKLDKFIRLLLLIQIPNFIIACIQFFLLGLKGDNLGGIFGSTAGCNGFVNMYLCICVTLIIELYFHKKVKLLTLAAAIISWIIISGLAELKIAFVEIPLIVVISILLNKPTLKSFFIIIVSIIAVMVGLELIVKYFPYWERAFNSIYNLIKIGSETGGGYNISRLNAFSDINRLIFKNDIILNLTGLGFGNCECSSYKFLTSDFYNSYGSLNYRWFSHQMWFLQTGYIGICLYTLFFFCAFIWIFKNIRVFKDETGYGRFGLIFIMLIAINFIYNASMTTEIGYLAFAALSIPFVYYVNLIKHSYKC